MSGFKNHLNQQRPPAALHRRKFPCKVISNDNLLLLFFVYREGSITSVVDDKPAKEGVKTNDDDLYEDVSGEESDDESSSADYDEGTDDEYSTN